MNAYKTIRQQFDEIGLQEENIERLFEVFKKNGQMLIPMQEVTLTPEHYIYRARPHDPGIQFTKRSEVSYNPFSDCIATGRANMRGNSVFYGAVSSQEIKLGYVIALQEASHIRHGWIPNVQTFTISRWRPRRNVELATFVPSKTLAAGMSVAQDMYRAVEEMLGSLHGEDKERAQEMIDVLSDEFSKEVEGPDDYWISSLFAHQMYSVKLGIAYPSKRADYMGFNVAVPAKAWDENFDLVDSVIYQYHKMGDKEITGAAYKFAIPEEPFLWRDDPSENPRPPFKLHPYPHKRPE